MQLLNLLCAIILFIGVTSGQKISYGTQSSISKSQTGAAVDEVVVESSLYIKKKPQIRRVRDLNNLVPLETLRVRVKRQNKHRRPVSSSQSAANAAANSNYYGPNGFGASAANAQAQGFHSQGQLGGFGASATNAQTQGFTAGPGGIQGGASFSGTQHYDLVDGRKVDVAFSNGFSAGPGGISGSKGNSVTIS